MKPIAVSFGSLKKIAISIAVSFVLAAFFVPNLSLAATELPGAISSVTNAGHIIYQDSVLYKDNFGSPSDYWTFRFNWPNGVGNTRAFLGVARGTFGNGDAPALYDNYAFNYQSC